MHRRKILLLTAAVPATTVLGAGRPALAGPPPNPIAPLKIAVEPLEAGDAAYALLAPQVAGGPEGAKVVLRLLLTNTGTKNMTIDTIEFVFPGGGTTPMLGVDILLNVNSDNGVFLPGQSKVWSNGTVTLPGNVVIKNQVYLPVPAPATVTVRVRVTGFVAPVEVTLPLTPYQVAHRLPIDVSDLRPGEVMSAAGDHWANGGVRGDQIYAHDVGVVGWDGAQWNRLLPGTDGSRNEHYRCWDLPVRAVADGTVLTASDGMIDNQAPGAFPDPTPAQVGGNQVWLRHDDGTLTYYTHLRQGTVTVVTGDTVAAGQVLGKLGDSGNASEPHIHLEVRQDKPGDNPLRPLMISDAWLVDRLANTPWNPESPMWGPTDGRAIPNSNVLIWPAASKPAWYPPGKSEIVLYGVPAGDYQVVFDRLKASGYRPVWIDAHEVDRSVFFNVIFHPKDGTTWQHRVGMTGAEYQTQFDGMDREGHRLTNVTSYVQDGVVRYAAIFCKQAGPTLAAYHGASKADHQAQFETLTKGGFRPVNISIVSPADDPRFTAFYHREDVGAFDAPSFATSADYQAAFTTNTKAGLHLTYFSACQHAGGFRISAIFQERAPGKGGTAGRHNMGSGQFGTELEDRRKADYLTRAVAGYVDGKTLRYGAAWRR
ncbi:peptidoglycan DD-metalloendopeptidase family protein [Micromonospora sp. NBC_01699]|uniref:peptidoglycan DD-metalloendopeptidase family protein n=1 Tax=Micromonospora sp. NBC_01699 TaxID=2975984 RepID=UPI002E286ED6|nr:peptidoglycan DD-metalloendopeptidase family protein [Micromonospora sp. NBC_01699]